MFGEINMNINNVLQECLTVITADSTTPNPLGIAKGTYTKSKLTHINP